MKSFFLNWKFLLLLMIVAMVGLFFWHTHNAQAANVQTAPKPTLRGQVLNASPSSPGYVQDKTTGDVIFLGASPEVKCANLLDYYFNNPDKADRLSVDCEAEAIAISSAMIETDPAFVVKILKAHEEDKN